jgi:formate-dependent nitrite reductase membrane component NrfD
MQGCPYDALYIDPETSTAAKCNYCSHRVDTGREPACVTVCPEDAIISGDMDDRGTEISRTIANQDVQTRKPEKGTEPKLHYVDGDDTSTRSGTTAREEHYMWSDAPNNVETQGAAQEDFDLQRAADSLAESDVTFSDESEAKTDGGYSTSSGNEKNTASKSKTERAYELVHEEAKRVYDVGENHHTSWGWEVYSYTWTKSISAGVMLVLASMMLGGVIEPDDTLFGVGALASVVFLGMTGVLLIIDLDQPMRFHWVLLRPNWNSWLVKGAYIITVFGAFLGLVIASWLFVPSLLTHPVVLFVAILLSIATAIYTAFLFSQSKGRDLWQSPAMPGHMIAQALVAGAAATGLIGVVAFDGLLGPSRWILTAGLLAHAGFIASEIFTPHQTEDAEEAAARITRGQFRTAFWAGGILLGILLPLAILLTTGASVAVGIAGIASLIGLFAFEYCWITAPQTISLA